MNYCQAPSVNKKRLIFKCVGAALLLFLCYMLTVRAMENADSYLRVKHAPLTLEATITHVDVSYDSEGSDDYYAMVTYYHDGRKYVAKYETFSNERSARALIGNSVTIQVDPEDPGAQLKDIYLNALNFLRFASLALWVVILLLRMRQRYTYVESYGWRQETVKKDIGIKIASSGADAVLLPIVYYYAIGALRPEVYIRFTFTQVLTIIVAMIGLVSLISKIRRLGKVKSDLFTLHVDSYVTKDRHYDSDGPDTFTITYKNDRGGHWQRSVSEREYNMAQKGDTICCAYLDGEKKPVLNSGRHGNPRRFR